MPITVKILKRTAGARPTLYASRDVDKLPVSIGRDAGCTIALEDPNKHMSRFHVEIQEDGGTYWLVVVSKVNPVMVKGQRYGPGTRLPLNSGDSFEVAEYEVQVLLPARAPAPAPAAPPAKVAPDATNPILTAAKAPALDDTKPVAAPKQEPPPEHTFVPQKAQAGEAPSHALRAFFEGAGLAHKELSPAQAERMLRECGAILRASVEGIMMLLLARAEMRKEFAGEERTMVAARDNNPLKLMTDANEAMDFLFGSAQRAEGFLEPVQAVSDACEDLRSHELALMAGMRAAILGALRHFDPHALERLYEKKGKGFSLGNRKAKLWELFVATQDKLSREAQEDFNKVFGRDFMGTYQAQLRRLKGGR